jgi:hypothetical protein
MAASRANNLILLLVLCASGSAFGAPSRVCELAVKRGGLLEYAVQVAPDKDGSRTVKTDIDLDGSADELRWFDSGSGSMLPADNSALTLRLTSNGKSFALEQQRLTVVKFESRYYVVTTRFETRLGPWYRDVFAVTQKGITEICSFEGKGQGPDA